MVVFALVAAFPLAALLAESGVEVVGSAKAQRAPGKWLCDEPNRYPYKYCVWSAFS